MPYDFVTNHRIKMQILYLLISISLIIVIFAVCMFIWAVRSGQYEDMEGPAHRILMDEDDPLVPRERQSKQKRKPDNS